MHAIARELPDCTIRFTPYYVDGGAEILRRLGLIERTVAGSRCTEACLGYLRDHGLSLSFRCRRGPFALFATSPALFLPRTRHPPPPPLFKPTTLSPPSLQ